MLRFSWYQVEHSGQPPVLLALLHYANVLGVFKELDTTEEGELRFHLHIMVIRHRRFQKTVLITGAKVCWERLLLNIYRNFDVVMIAHAQ